MNDHKSANRRRRKTMMRVSVVVLYIMLGLATIGLLFLESGSRLQVVGLVCTVVGFYLLTLLVICWRKQERTLGTPPPCPMPSPAPPKTRLPFRVAGIMIAIPALASGCFVLAMLSINWMDTLKEPVLSIVLAGMGLCAVFCGSLFGYCCVTGKEWPTPAIRH
jgi:hypothetical protein